jgi:hypothetical protein
MGYTAVADNIMRHIITILFLFTSASSLCQTKHKLDSLTHVLEKVSVDDQKYRLVWESTMQKYGINSSEFIDLIKKVSLQDSVNMLIVGNILDKFGWLSKEQTSEDANDALFLVIQHAPLQAQLKYLPLMKQAVADKKAKANAYALLVDRTNMYQGKFQIYGSQLNYDAKGHLHIFPIIDEPNVDNRRKSAGLTSLRDYLNLFNQNLSYTLPKMDKYKNKIVVNGSITGKKDNQPLPNVYIYSTNNLLSGMSDSSGFFQVIIPEKDRAHPLVFKKNNFETVKYKLENNTKQVIEINLTLQTVK